jgi:hypothetical protein
MKGPPLPAVAAASLFAVLLLTPAGVSADEVIDATVAAKAQELLTVSHSLDRFNQGIDLMEPQLIKVIESVNPGKAALIKELMDEHFVPEVRRREPELLQVLGHIYAQHFTAAELDQLIGFYQSPIGQRLLEEQGPMLGEMTKVAMLWGQGIAAEILRKMAPEFERRGLKMPSI